MTRKIGGISLLAVALISFCIMLLTLHFKHRSTVAHTTSPQATPSAAPMKPGKEQNVSPTKSAWHQVIIRDGDSLAAIFNRLKIKQSDLLAVVQHEKKLMMLHPGETVYLQTDTQHQLQGLKYPIDAEKTLLLERQNNKFTNQIEDVPLSESLSFKAATIHRSLDRTAKQAGLTRTMLRQLQTIFGGTINFTHDVHTNDHFAILYQEYYAGGKKVRSGDIMAAEFTTHGKTYRAIRYTYPTHHTGYYTPNGHGVEPRFLRAPLHYDHISSRFSYHRMDPVIHRVHPHLGVDFAASAGTPVKSIGDGNVVFVGRDAGYGNTIRIQYGPQYEALYGHMRRFAKNVKLHEYIRKGETIGYVGTSGWATGPHLHFGFYVHGIARNWLAIKMPAALSIPRTYLARFMDASKRLMAQLQLYQDTELAANNTKETAERVDY